ncbi:hypothetical protein MCUN1_000345 [Malassezia cuniculi]|uniref:Major facilitator superfamily (MFS) profile domain-containing protein n=1 Tax=Malassezia cuniculi TaxID=948313 RepID=A0AAF0EV74_9BASI|nr:hypothetical protein MCUN1_000345 [Malassezia cuniculi]
MRETPAALVIAWGLLATFQFGYGISELNAIQEKFTCTGESDCLGLSANAFGIITSMFTLGGAISSFLCGMLVKQVDGVFIATLRNAALAGSTGSVLLILSSTTFFLGLGRFFQGIAAGVGITLVPVLLKTVSPPAISGSVGVLNQVAIVTGIFCAQATGMLTCANNWRAVAALCTLVACAQYFGGHVIKLAPGDAHEDDESAPAVPSSVVVEQEPSDQLHAAPSQTLPAQMPQPPLSSATQSYQSGLRIIVLTQLAQQLSGVNAIMFYSTGILSAVMPGVAQYVGLLITVVNGVMTFPPIYLIDERRVGRKRLLVGSAAGMGLCCLVLAYSLSTARVGMSAFAIVAVIACFSVGLGPVPFVIMPEVVPKADASRAASLGMTVNWVSNAAVALAFQPVRTILSPIDGGAGGLVFVIFGVVNLVFAALIAQRYTYMGSSI